MTVNRYGHLMPETNQRESGLLDVTIFEESKASGNKRESSAQSGANHKYGLLANVIPLIGGGCSFDDTSGPTLTNPRPKNATDCSPSAAVSP